MFIHERRARRELAIEKRAMPGVVVELTAIHTSRHTSQARNHSDSHPTNWAVGFNPTLLTFRPPKDFSARILPSSVRSECGSEDHCHEWRHLPALDGWATA